MELRATGWRDKCFPDFLRSVSPEVLTRYLGDQTSGGMCKSQGCVLNLHTRCFLCSSSLGEHRRRIPRVPSALVRPDSTLFFASTRLVGNGLSPALGHLLEEMGLTRSLTSRTLASHSKPVALARPLSLSWLSWPSHVPAQNQGLCLTSPWPALFRYCQHPGGTISRVESDCIT